MCRPFECLEMIHRILELFAVSLIIMAENGGSLVLLTTIDIKQICKTTVEITCSSNNVNRGIWNIYRSQDGSKELVNMAKIDDSKLKCQVSAQKLYKSTKCICFETNRITCTIHDDKVVHTGHQWECNIFVNRTTDVSKPRSVEIDNVEECTTTHVTAHVSEESNTLFTTGSIGMIEDTDNVFKEMEENITTQSFKITTIQIDNDVDEIERKGSQNKPDITQLALMIAGPFIAFDIGLIMFIYRKKLLSCLAGKHDSALIHTNTSNFGDRNININSECNNDACSNCNLPSNERTRMCQPTTGPAVDQISIDLNGDQQADTDTRERIEDDPLYSRVQGNAKMCAEAGACGFTLHGEEFTPADAVYIDIDNIDAHYATVKRDGPPGSKTHTGKRLFATRTNVTKIVNEDPLYSKGLNDMCQSPLENPLYPVDNAAFPFNGDSSYSSEDPLYSVVNKPEGIYSLAKNIDPLFSTVRKKKQICEIKQSSGAFDTVAIKADPLYSVVDKTKNRDAGNDWNTTVPPAPLRHISTYPPYSKVNKKNTQRVDTDGTTEEKS